MDTISQLFTIVAQSGLPVVIIVWGQWFATTRVWPWWSGPRAEHDMELSLLQAKATLSMGDGLQAIGHGLQAQSRAIQALTDCLLKQSQAAPSPTDTGGD